MGLEDKINNEVTVVAKDYLENVGVHVNTDLSVFEANKEEYIKIDKSIVAKVDAVMQQLPQIVLNKAYSGDVYRVIYDKGVGVLQKSAQHPGMLLGNVVSPDANNKIRDVALLSELSMGPQVFSGVFSAMSMITGQYYMTQINNHLSQIEEGVAAIQKFLEDDKKSQLESEEEFLKQVQQMLPFILGNESQKQSTITSIQKIKIDSLASINFYKKQINDLKDIDVKKDKAEEVISNIQRISFLISEYWYSLYLYSFASCLEPVVAQNFDTDYITFVKADVKAKCNQYEKDYAMWKRKLDEYISTAKAFGENKLLAVLKVIGKNKVYGNVYVFITQALIDVVANVADSADKKVKNKKKNEAYEYLLNGNIGSDIKAIECRQSELTIFESLYNGQLELVKDKEDMYIKIPR